MLRALARLLRTYPFDVRTYQSARIFLDSLPEWTPDCLISDLRMPEMTGSELQHCLSRLGIRIPTIIITAHDEAEMRERCKTAGAIAFLTKLIQDTSLVAAIDAASASAGK